MEANQGTDLSAEIGPVASRMQGLDLLVLHGSAATGTAHELSDWDFAFQGGPELDVDGLRLALSRVLDSDRIDLANLTTANGLLRYRVARDARLVFERTPGFFQDFRIRVTIFWCDVEPVLRRSYSHVLESLEG